MDVKLVIFGETGLDRLLQWLRTTGEPQDLRVVLEEYLRILRDLVLEGQE